MDRIWKYFTVLVLIEMTFFIYFYVIVFNHSTTISKEEDIEVKERGQFFVDEKTRADTLLPRLKIDRHKKTEKILYMTNHTVHSNTTLTPLNKEQQFKSNSLPFSNVTENMQTDGAKNVVQSAINKRWSIGAKGNVHSHNTSYISMINDKSCIFSFDNNSLFKAKEQLSSPYYLFNVHLEIDGLHSLSNEIRDKLLHWQYVLKKEKFLIQLPVDVDLLTYTLLEIDKEETTISIKLLYNNFNCFQDNFQEAILSVQLLLWNKLFLNDTDHYLCNRYYESVYFIEILYYLTTIWVGYDLTCSEMSTRNGLHVVHDIRIEKGWTPIITSIFCYVLSLQFVWIFVLLDVRKYAKLTETGTKIKRNLVSSDTDKTNETFIQSENNPEKSEANQTNKEIMEKGNYPVSSSIDETNEKSIEGENSPEISEANQTNEEILKIGKSPVSNNIDETSEKSIQGGSSPEISETNKKTEEIIDKEIGNVTSEQKKKKEPCLEDSKSDPVKIVCCPKFSESKNNFYTINDRPYGLKRFILKILHGKCSCICCCCKCFCEKCCFHNPAMRLLFLLWIFILLTFGFYRTFGRFKIFRNTYEYSLTVARPSEPLIHLINCCLCMSEESIVALDIIYATVFPFFYIFVGHVTYEVFLSNDMRLCYCVSEDKHPHLITNNERIDNRFTFRYFQFCTNLGKLCCPNDRLLDKNGCKCTDKFKEGVACVLSCIYCVFPCIPFSCFTHKYVVIKGCECCMVENKEKHKPVIDRNSNGSNDQLKNGKGRESGSNENKEQNKGGIDRASGSDTNKEQNKNEKGRERGSNENKEPPKDREDRESGSDTNKEQNKGAKDRENSSNGNKEPHQDGEDRESGSNENEEQNKGAKDRGSGRNENEAPDKDGNKPESGSNKIKEQNNREKLRESGRNENKPPDKYENEHKCSKACKCCCIFCFNFLCLFIGISYLICLRPIFSTFTFLLRSFTYIVFVVFPTRTYIMRVFVMIVTPIVYILNYIHEIINMNTEILNYILKLEESKILTDEQIKTEHRQESKLEQISEEDFDGVYENLMFVKKRFYLLYLKVIIVIMYIFITFTTFILNTKSLTGSDFKDILQFVLIIIGPYAIIFFLKANKSDFLTEENKTQIQEAYENKNETEKEDVKNV